ncbi:MAG: hypothetical protein JNL68_00790 [Burkholderiales bacterium]|nr:hypothetical protein [Burkholderiales bacterium]
MERTNDIPSKKALTAVLLVLVSTVGWIGETCAHDGKRLIATLQTTTRFIPVNELKPGDRCLEAPPPRYPPIVGRLEAVGAGNAELVGAGNTSFKGPVTDDQSHCVHAGGAKASKGRFTLTNAQGRKIEGRYFAELVPTFNPTSFIINGMACVAPHTRLHVDHDCFRPARGLTDLVLGNATIFLDQRVDD